MFASTRGGSSAINSSRLQSRRGGGNAAGPRKVAISPLVIIVAAGTVLSLCLMALGWSVIVLVHQGPSSAATDTTTGGSAVQMRSAAMTVPAPMSRRALRANAETTTSNNNNNNNKKKIPARVRYPLATDLKLPTPILVVGMPKVGTTSIASYFRCGGIRASHFSCEVNDDDDLTRPWRNCLLPRGAGGGGSGGRGQGQSDAGTEPLCAVCIERNIVRGRPPFEGCGPYEVFGEMDSAEHPLPMVRDYAHDHDAPKHGDGANDGNRDADGRIQPLCSFPQITHLDEIHASYPNATLILNTRPVDHWIQSISNWNPTPNRADGGYLRRVLAMCDLGPGFGTGIGATEEELARFYLGHSERIRNFARDHPSHALVEVDIEDKQAGETMENAFGINKQCWGKQNAASPIVAAQNANISGKSGYLNGMQNKGEGVQSTTKRTSPRILGQPQEDVHVATSTTRKATAHNLTSAIAASQAQAELLFAQYSAQKAYNAEMALDYPYCSDIEDIFPRQK